ncbi:YjfB family protein [Noviherbaspirillum aerium]|uniref:YjfB family protein n=1 Tax=Noviherbaspirillum aerium TaxID=2588497 RepID=UPI00124EE771|nr:YjfB family protein [Noviherbaspirillum aerium]
MEVTDIARLATTMASTATADAVNVAVLKKAMDMQASNATALLQALPPVTPAANLPPHLGQNVNTTA